MRFTSAFILTLLSALTVLADFKPYAGTRYRQTRSWFSYVTTVVVVPNFRAPRNCHAAYAFIVAAIGDPRDKICGGKGFEAGINFSCNQGGYGIQTYSRFLPGPPVQQRVFMLPIDIGDKIQVEIRILYTNIEVRFTNLRKKLNPSWKEVGSAFYLPEGCRATAMWVLRSGRKFDGSLWPLPGFDRMEFPFVKAVDGITNQVTNQEVDSPRFWVPEGKDASGRLVMEDSNMGVMATPNRIDKTSFEILQ